MALELDNLEEEILEDYEDVYRLDELNYKFFEEKVLGVEDSEENLEKYIGSVETLNDVYALTRCSYLSFYGPQENYEEAKTNLKTAKNLLTQRENEKFLDPEIKEVYLKFINEVEDKISEERKSEPEKDSSSVFRLLHSLTRGKI